MSSFEKGKKKDKLLLLSFHKYFKLCGKRLKELGSKYKITKVIHSTMLRASETAQIIHKELADSSVPLKSDILLCEGAPYPPEPPVDHWKPDIYVGIIYLEILPFYTKLI